VSDDSNPACGLASDFEALAADLAPASANQLPLISNPGKSVAESEVIDLENVTSPETTSIEEPPRSTSNMWRQLLTGWSGTKRQKSNAASATNSTTTVPVFQSPGDSATVPELTDTAATEGTSAEGAIAEGATAEGTCTTVVDGTHKRSSPADPLQTTEDITLDMMPKGRNLCATAMMHSNLQRSCLDPKPCSTLVS
jgi:hypothetical protein